MRKIALLLVAAVFVIGIQSCSTEEIGIEEETNQELLDLQKRGSLGGTFSVRPLYVYYPANFTAQDRLNFKDSLEKMVFGSILAYTNHDCPNVDIWYVSGDILIEKPGKSILEADKGIPDDSDEIEDDPIINPDGPYYAKLVTNNEIIDAQNFCSIVNQIILYQQ
ncbi:hypothetical protein GCM10009430_47030 [Aquimarina litoralis]|uniref:Uncharacterized protein n=1 Tax=Aquimarina litoralis TaxID=584605 RepID=A0ABN1J9L2_9FLAO